MEYCDGLTAEVNALSMMLRSVEELRETDNELILVFSVENIWIKVNLKWHNFVIYITIKILNTVFWNALNGAITL